MAGTPSPRAHRPAGSLLEAVEAIRALVRPSVRLHTESRFVYTPRAMRRSTRRLVAWIAGFAVLFGAAAPTLARALAAWQQDGKIAWTEVCTSTGWVRIEVPASNPPDDSRKGNPASGLDCPYCLRHAGSFTLPGTLRLAVPAVEPFHPLPELAYHSPRLLFAWAAAQPRAPPLAS